jgi:hypothetical protein
VLCKLWHGHRLWLTVQVTGGTACSWFCSKYNSPGSGQSSMEGTRFHISIFRCVRCSLEMGALGEPTAPPQFPICKTDGCPTEQRNTSH